MTDKDTITVWQPHYTDNPYPEDPAPTEDTCQACYEADPDIPHTRGCEQ